jgi:hypothetical protein
VSNFTQWLAVYMATECSRARFLSHQSEPLPPHRRNVGRTDGARQTNPGAYAGRALRQPRRSAAYGTVAGLSRIRFCDRDCRAGGWGFQRLLRSVNEAMSGVSPSDIPWTSMWQAPLRLTDTIFPPDGPPVSAAKPIAARRERAKLAPSWRLPFQAGPILLSSESGWPLEASESSETSRDRPPDS